MESLDYFVRSRYIENISKFKDSDVIKIVTGMHGVGKTSLLNVVKQFYETESSNPNAEFIYIDLSDDTREIDSGEKLFHFISENHSELGRTYIFIDEIQLASGWQDATNAMKQSFDCDIYLSGSNAYLLFNSISIQLSSRFTEIKVISLTFSEFLDICGIEVTPEGIPSLNGIDLNMDNLIDRYLEYGGMPEIASLDTSIERRDEYIAYLIERTHNYYMLNKRLKTSDRNICKAHEFEHISSGLAAHVGQPVTASVIAKEMTSNGFSISDKTVKAYIDALLDSYLFCKIQRYDIKKQVVLKTQPRLYVSDLGILSYCVKDADISQVAKLENAILLHLLYAGFDVHIGKIYNKEISFVAMKGGRTIYFQVADDIQSPEKKTNILAPSQVHSR